MTTKPHQKGLDTLAFILILVCAHIALYCAFFLL